MLKSRFTVRMRGRRSGCRRWCIKCKDSYRFISKIHKEPEKEDKEKVKRDQHKSELRPMEPIMAGITTMEMVSHKLFLEFQRCLHLGEMRWTSSCSLQMRIKVDLPLLINKQLPSNKGWIRIKMFNHRANRLDLGARISRLGFRKGMQCHHLCCRISINRCKFRRVLPRMWLVRVSIRFRVFQRLQHFRVELLHHHILFSRWITAFRITRFRKCKMRKSQEAVRRAMRHRWLRMIWWDKSFWTN